MDAPPCSCFQRVWARTGRDVAVEDLQVFVASGTFDRLAGFWAASACHEATHCFTRPYKIPTIADHLSRSLMVQAWPGAMTCSCLQKSPAAVPPLVGAPGLDGPLTGLT